MAKTESIRAMLAEGKDRISVGRAEEVAGLVIAPSSPAKGSGLFSQVMECLWDDDPGVANRAAHAIERITRDGDPGPIAQLNSWKTSLLGLLTEATENKMRWHLALVAPRLTLSPSECARVAAALQAWLEDESSSIVKTMSLQGLTDLTRQHPSFKPALLDLLRIYSRTGTAAMQARARLLLQGLEKAEDANSQSQRNSAHSSKNRSGKGKKPDRESKA